MFKTLAQRTVYQNPWMTVFEDDVQFPDGHTGIYGYMTRANGVSILIVDELQRVLLVEQYRYPIHQLEWTLPGGGIDPGETPTAAIQREVTEETGLVLTQPLKLQTVYALDSGSSESETIFLGRINSATVGELKGGQADEFFTRQQFFPLTEVIDMIDQGKIVDALVGHAVQLIARRLAKEPELGW